MYDLEDPLAIINSLRGPVEKIEIFLFPSTLWAQGATE
jgi:hypothetical protein